MGPAIFRKQGKNTLFTIRILPLGGYCSMDEDEEAVSENSFRSKSVWRRMAVIAAGAIMSLILGFLISIVTLLVAQQYATNIVAEISDGSGCQAAGMQVGDRIV